MPRKLCPPAVLLLLSCGMLHAEEAERRVLQLGIGGSYARSNRLPEKNGFGGLIFGASFAQNRWLRWAGVGGFEWAGSPIQPVPPEGIPAGAVAPVDQMLTQFHAGPELIKQARRAALFAHVLPGYTGWSLGQSSEGGRGRVMSEGGFSLAAGCGVDWHARSHFDIRFQGDYIPAWLGQGTPNVTLNPPLPASKAFYGNFRVGLMFIVTNRKS
jgi:hypothetical protein